MMIISTVGDTQQDVQEEWKHIQEVVLPDIRKYNANDSHKEISEFLLVKCDR